jgi:hypothetical protein
MAPLNNRFKWYKKTGLTAVFLVGSVGAIGDVVASLVVGDTGHRMPFVAIALPLIDFATGMT